MTCATKGAVVNALECAVCNRVLPVMTLQLQIMGTSMGYQVTVMSFYWAYQLGRSKSISCSFLITAMMLTGT